MIEQVRMLLTPGKERSGIIFRFSAPFHLASFSRTSFLLGLMRGRWAYGLSAADT
jgi:hypothetical protein